MSETLALLLVTFPDRDEAVRVAEAVLAEKLAACVNILDGCTSVYRWQGEVQQADEVLALFKTAPIRARRLADRIAAMHSYDLPAIEMLEAGAGPQIMEWITRETG